MRLIDAEELECLFNEQIEQGATDAFDAFDDALQDATTVYAVVVVRCKDCRKFKIYACRMVASGYDDFCSYGERKDGGDAER